MAACRAPLQRRLLVAHAAKFLTAVRAPLTLSLVAEHMTERQLLTAARRQGCKVSADQLKRWRRAELIPRPIQTHPTGQLGSQATYPPGTLTRLLAVCELRKRFRRLERIRFELWWSGHYAGAMAPIRAFLIAQLEGLLTELREHRDRFDDPFDAAEAATSDSNPHLRHRGLRTMRRLAKDDQDFGSAMFAILLDLFGGEPAWDLKSGDEPSLAELVERATGVERAKTDRLFSGERLLPATTSIVDTIQDFGQSIFNLDDPGWAIREASDAQLVTARVQARLIVQGLPAVAHIVAARYGRDHAGLSVLGALDSTDPVLVTVVVQWALLMPSLMTTEAETTTVAKTLDALAVNADKLACAELFITELPKYAFLLKPDRDATLESLTSEERTLIASQVNNFLIRHPECSQSFESEQ